MRSNTQTISIQAPPAKIVEFLADPRNLPRWAVGFARAVRHEEGRWLVTTGGGDVALRIDTDARLGVVDYVLSPAPGVESVAATRVLPRGGGAEVVFTQHQGPGMPDEVFDQNVRAVAHELTVLRAVLEVECPL